jgi:ribosomal protein L24E
MYREINEMPKCDNCGILMPAGSRLFEHHGVVLDTCSERCERVYDTYKFPRYRDQILAAERAGSGQVDEV